MLFDVQLDRGNVYHLMAIGVGVNSFQFLSTTSTGFGIMVGYALTLFYSDTGDGYGQCVLLPRFFPVGFFFLVFSMLRSLEAGGL
jgi:hypothetical protein